MSAECQRQRDRPDDNTNRPANHCIADIGPCFRAHEKRIDDSQQQRESEGEPISASLKRAESPLPGSQQKVPQQGVG